MMLNKSVLIMAGGTGGHIFPGLALAEEMGSRGYRVEWLGTRVGLEARLVPAADINLHFIPVRGLRGKGLKNLLLAPINIVCSVVSALKVIRSIKPGLVVGLGGFVAGPGGVAAKIDGIPLVIHEQNAVAGTTNRLLSRIANKVLMAFPCDLKGGVCIGNPVRKEIENIQDPRERMHGRAEKTNVLILGGSRGAQAVNEMLPMAFKHLGNREGLNIWHQAGAEKDESTRNAYREADVKASVDAFIDDMREAFTWADIVICRAGALTISELAAAGLGSVLIPFPYAIDDHQTANARFLERAGAAFVKQQRELTTETLVELFENVLFDKEKLTSMAINARAEAKPKAAEVFADYCEEALNA